MRLTQIKLAGFKSFVDPTSISIPGDLVGVVGPNGCGKSNIIDAVRWVLGESRASALRGDSMQDVIFNGSSLRKSLARASVELSFDNSLGKATGQWSQYAEVSVKRLLQRDGESVYFINNTHVRRRDVQDIFLGTGLGPRAYAIIEQGMISRIIEARPEELRIFLEEAAGISKYKERRRETELRLADTRENLARVQDIRQELSLQIEKLEMQADVARRYHELAADRQFKQDLLALLRKNEAGQEAQRHAREIEKSALELEAETARLREIEKQLELARTEHYAVGDALNAAQGELYGANAEVSRLESEIRHVTETRARVEAQLTQLLATREAGEGQQAALREARQLWATRLNQAEGKAAEAQRVLAEHSARLPEAESALRSAQSRLAEHREKMAQEERGIQVEETHMAHANRVLQGLQAREQRLLDERQELVAPDVLLAQSLAQEIERSRAELGRQEALLEQLEAARAGVEHEWEAAQARVIALERELSGLDAKLLTLQKIQSQVEENGQLQDWIGRHRLGDRARLWHRIKVESGWETAVESVLREKLHAIELADGDALQALTADPPGARASAFAPGGREQAVRIPGLRSLSDLVAAQEQAIRPALEAWLRGCFAVDGTPDLATRIALDANVILVNREGHQFGRYGVDFFAPDPADSGILARQREIEALVAAVRQRQGEIERATEEMRQIETRLGEHDQGLVTLRAAGDALKQRHHERELDQLKLTQGQERHAERSAQVERELAEIAQLKALEEQHRAAAQASHSRHRLEWSGLSERLASVGEDHAGVEAALEGQRRALQQADREAQEMGYFEKDCNNKISEIDRSLNVLEEQLRAAGLQASRLQGELGQFRDQDLRRQLHAALEVRVIREQALSAARSRQDDAAARLREAEEIRLGIEQKLQPLRDRIGELRLKEQAARMNYEQFAAQLAEAGADEAALAGSLREGQKAAPLQGEITRLTNAINELGAINMAALDELAASKERNSYLDSQAADLTEALQTLENAIRKIDRETRDLLQSTFDAVNRHFGELFPLLFGGGEARLVMTGEQILDSGVQVIARPPGKRNTTIHLLSGGEKALVAIALVFSMFQLNAAPFCLLDEVDAPLDDANTERFCELVRKMAKQTQFLFISHNKITMEMAGQLIGVTMQEQGVSRVVAVDIEEAMRLREEAREPVAT